MENGKERERELRLLHKVKDIKIKMRARQENRFSALSAFMAVCAHESSANWYTCCIFWWLLSILMVHVFRSIMLFGSQHMLQLQQACTSLEHATIQNYDRIYLYWYQIHVAKPVPTPDWKQQQGWDLRCLYPNGSSIAGHAALLHLLTPPTYDEMRKEDIRHIFNWKCSYASGWMCVAWVCAGAEPKCMIRKQ